MRRVSNSRNGDVLVTFRRRIIEPIMKICLEIASGKVRTARDSPTYISLARRNLSAPLARVLGKKVRKKTVQGYLLALADPRDRDLLRREIRIYRTQNRSVDTGKYRIDPVAVRDEWKILFNEVFYKKIFDDEKLWSLLSQPEYGRGRFHDWFLWENGTQECPLGVCPYCDIDTIQSAGAPIIEHFLPKSIFPFLSMNHMNLFSACGACNSPGYGKGVDREAAATTPYTEEIGSRVEFAVDHVNCSVDLDAGADVGIQGYAKLLHLNERYRNPRVYRYLEKYIEELVESLGNSGSSRSEVEEYFLRCRQVYPFFFLSRSAFLELLD